MVVMDSWWICFAGGYCADISASDMGYESQACGYYEMEAFGLVVVGR